MNKNLKDFLLGLVSPILAVLFIIFMLGKGIRTLWEDELK